MNMPVFAPAAAIAAMLGFADGAYAKTLIHCSFASPDGFNASLVTGTATSDVARQVQNPLVDFELGTTNIVPALAQSWEISPDGTVYTFQLRKNVKFHTTANFSPTRDFDADDVLYSWNRMWRVDHPDHMLGGGSYETFASNNLPKLLKSIDKIDDYTVRFVLNRPEAPFLATITHPFAAILSAEYAEEMRQAGTPDKIDHKPVGTGPFVFVDYQKDSTVRLKAFDEYWDGRAKIDTLIFAITPDAAVRLVKLKAGECHVAALPNPSDLQEMRQDPNIRLLEQVGLNVGYLAFNTEKEPFINRSVRQALNMAVDKQAILDAIFQGSGAIAKNPIPPAQWGYNDNVRDYPYDPEAAKKSWSRPDFLRVGHRPGGDREDAAVGADPLVVVDSGAARDGRRDRLGLSRHEGRHVDRDLGRRGMPSVRMKLKKARCAAIRADTVPRFSVRPASYITRPFVGSP